ncbi:FtsW/RodA/SpoVE family cell cycle protein [Jeotgalibacillus marinus]|uniref:FtsW/RodA/SpoVE family cell cycle protein n=1 Tax=Jeotgalibacillus marinus TaxID=86667 RepID=A0ABV3Q8E4_9BACL
MKQPDRFTERFDWGLTFILLVFCIISLVGISSAQGQYEGNFVLKQAIWYGVGFFIIVGAVQFEPDQYRKMAPYLYVVGVTLLMVLAVAPESIAQETNGATRWLELPGIGSFQPSELMKIFYILMLASVVSRHQENFILKNIKHDLWLLGKILLVALIPMAFILRQPDLGTSLVFIAISAGVIIVSGVSWKLLIPAFSLTAVGSATVYFLVMHAPDWLELIGLRPYQFDRVISWRKPELYAADEGYNLLQAMTSIGSGQMLGNGFQSNQVNVPEHHTDFIFTTFGEDFGFIGASFVVAWFMFLIYHLTHIALLTKDPFSTYLSVGVISMLTFQVFQNIGMTIQVLPVTGLTLPLVSYGGTSIMITMFSLGLIYSIRFHHRNYMFGGDTEIK